MRAPVQAFVSPWMGRIAQGHCRLGAGKPSRRRFIYQLLVGFKLRFGGAVQCHSLPASAPLPAPQWPELHWQLLKTDSDFD
jgi:hypothetical protein